ncbi:MAG: DegT/DnrJ/EryC1/StrS family aminotransferase, partial [Verrucomicrobiota bacterium]
MPTKKKKQQSDFRYAVGDARVPWHTVGERFDAKDITEVVKFLMPPSGDDNKAYTQSLREVGSALRQLGKQSSLATKLSLGTQVAAAENEAKELLGVKHACYLANWTGGMEIAYKLSGLQPGDEVIVPSITFIASVAYPLAVGAKLVFADVDPRTVNMDPADVARKITKRTRVIMPVHIGGYPCDMTKIMKLAKEHDLFVIEDAAHGLGAMYKGKPLGTIGHFGGYSMHEVKNINSFGEGGLLVTNEPSGTQFSRGRFLGLDFTRTIENWLYDITPLEDRFGKPQVPGNYSATEIAALGYRLQAKRLDKIIAKRKKHADYLRDAFAKEKGILLPPADTAKTYGSHHLFLLRIDPKRVGADIQALKRKLKEKGVTEVTH